MGAYGKIAIVDVSPKIPQHPFHTNSSFFQRVAKLASGLYVRAELSKDGRNVRVPRSVHGCDVYIAQGATGDIGSRTYELLHAVSAANSHVPSRVSVIMPYCLAGTSFKPESGGSNALLVLLKSLKALDVKSVITTGLHDPAMRVGFDFVGIPLQYLPFEPIAADYALRASRDGKKHLVIAGPDFNMMERLKEVEKMVTSQRSDLQCSIAGCNSIRNENNSVVVKSVVGDVSGRSVLLYDDEARSLNTARAALEKFAEQGATEARMLVTHSMLADTPETRANLEAICKNLFVQEIVFGDTTPLPEFAAAYAKVRSVSTRELFAEAIRLHNNGDKHNRLSTYAGVMGIYQWTETHHEQEVPIGMNGATLVSVLPPKAERGNGAKPVTVQSVARS